VVSQFSVSMNHPSLAGHFPGNPIVPGVVILDEIIHTIESNWEEKTVTVLKFVKFIKPLRAEQKVTLTVDETDTGTLKFVCKKNGEIFVSGQCIVTEKVLA
jgi:3-hydroxyacyl-[acyl-carrier-protein] dehydratase